MDYKESEPLIRSLLQELEELKQKVSVLEKNEGEEVKQIYAEVEKYLYVVSHELKAPLREIDLYAQFIEEDSLYSLLPQSRNDLSAIRRTCKGAMEMIQQFMKYSRTGNMVLNREVISLKALVTECFENLIRLNPGRRLL